MKQPLLLRILIAFFLLVFTFACESRKSENPTKPHEFEPGTSTSTEIRADSQVVEDAETNPQTPEISEGKTARKPMPTVEELKEITPDLEAKRALNNDAMKAAQMKPDEFIAYMKTRIPYYRGKGNLKAENDMVRIRISKTEMKIETMKGAQTFPMQ